MRSTNDTTPTISGTTDEPVGTGVTVTVAGQTLNTTVGAGGNWAVSATVLAPGPHAVDAAVTDASQNVGTADQTLTVDVTAPAVSINGGPSRATKDTTPAISGTTDAPPGTLVTVTVGGQTLTTNSVGGAGAWLVTAEALAETTHSVVASVEDGAENTATASQILTVDVTVPVVTINGGATRSTDDTSPWTYGTTAEQAGTIVHLTIGGQHLTATVESGGTWGVSAQALPEGTYHVVASVTDAAQNTGTAHQTLTIGDAGGPGGPDPRYRPDAAVRLLSGKFVGVGSYGDGQRVTKRLKPRANGAAFQVRVTNRGDATDRMEILGTPKNGNFNVIYLAGGRNVTGAVTSGNYRTDALSPGESAHLVIKVTRTKAARAGDRRSFTVRADSSHSRQRDLVAAVVVKG